MHQAVSESKKNKESNLLRQSIY